MHFVHGFALVGHCFPSVKFPVYKFNSPSHMKASFLRKICSSFSKTATQNSPGVKLLKMIVIYHLLLTSTGLITRVLVGCEWRIIFLFKIDTLGHKRLSPIIFSHGGCHELDLS